jgi:hypothetical protein
VTRSDSMSSSPSPLSFSSATLDSISFPKSNG